MKKIILAGFIVMTITVISCSSAKKTENSNQPNGAPPSTDEAFAMFDTNKDGKLSKAEVKGPLLNDFAKIDTNGDGFITKEELNKAPKPNRQGPPQGGGQQGPPPNGGK
jgi:hypothetical protein